ncbi:hypothetical protein B0H63DRAFT_305521 [Podospora didyma]|uniref:Uncharacterized protein n=1 Tax=Podospora didyma TaxID=330526 RepID=A0AAE0K645_9PEZI|nr:hypothetical protein B0H63DRAFT_305521 [Podospora didyma]
MKLWRDPIRNFLLVRRRWGRMLLLSLTAPSPDIAKNRFAVVWFLDAALQPQLPLHFSSHHRCRPRPVPLLRQSQCLNPGRFTFSASSSRFAKRL